MTTHAKLSPSSAVRWLSCPASVVMQEGMQDKQSQYGAEGTAAHYIAELCLLENVDAASYQHEVVRVTATGNCALCPMGCVSPSKGEFDFEVTQEFAEHVQTYLDLVRHTVIATNGEMLVEQRLLIEAITGEKGAKGTSDAVILAEKEIVVIDLKFGQGDKTQAKENPQLMIYGLSALLKYDILSEYEQVRLIISQPRRQHVSEWVISADDLRAFGRSTRKAAKLISTLTIESDLSDKFGPTAEGCKYCKARFDCPALAEQAMKVATEQFEDIVEDGAVKHHISNEQLVENYEKLDIIKLYVKTVEDAILTRLRAGEELTGYKLVRTAGGKRKWVDDEAADKAMQAMRLKVDKRYKRSVISPTEAEKLAKSGLIGDIQWTKLQEYVTRSEGKETIAPADDRRAAIEPVVNMFEDLT